MERPDFFNLKNGEKAKLPFTDQEYQRRLANLRTTMSKNNLDMIILTSMHNIAYYTGFIYCSFGRPYGCVVTTGTQRALRVTNRPADRALQACGWRTTSRTCNTF